MRTVKDECLHRMVFFGEMALRNAVREFLIHYHQERNHQGIDNRLIEPGDEGNCTTDDIACRERLGGMLRYYRRAA
jgi:putative transposase